MIIFIIISLQTIYSCISICPSNYTEYKDSCFAEFTSQKDFCQSNEYCQLIDGRLIGENDLENVITFKKDIKSFIGMADLLNERENSRDKWQTFDNNVTNYKDIWHSGEPTSGTTGEDCVEIYDKKINDIPCQSIRPGMCIYFKEKSRKSLILSMNHIDLFNNDKESGCYEILKISLLKCAFKCLSTNACRSVYYRKPNNLCLIVKFIDSTLPKSFDNSNDKWIRYQIIDTKPSNV